MDGYKIVYKEPDGTITHTFFGEPITNISLPKQCYMEVIKLFFWQCASRMRNRIY